ncbi:AcaB family transcriptional regulator [Vibrio diazotrophicus]|jgi:hypothetical protein|uniref:AcaB family transcriptional regulator n=1 Tax=Vibrio diazotrophicus TaxID=685 RepID=UPI003D2F66AB
MTTNNQTLSSTAIENVQSIGEGSIEMHGYTVENKPDIPYIEVRFFTKMAVSLLFSQGKTEGQRKGAEKKRFIHGADWLNSKIYTIIEAIKADDPFADQMLFNVEQSIQALGNELAEVKKYLLKSLEKRLGESNAKVTFNSNMHTITANITYENRISYDLLLPISE